MRRNIKEIVDNAKALTDCVVSKNPLIEPVIAAVEVASPKE